VAGFGLVDWDSLTDRIRKLVRAKSGLQLDDDVFQGLIRANDDRERTKLTTHNVYRHAFMDLLTNNSGEEWKIVKDWAEEERHLFISEDGQRATDFIMAIRRKQEEQVPVTNITMQNQPTQEPQKKKGWFHRGN
jgi:hypothetical protein